MPNSKVSSQLRILIFEGIEAMGARRDDLLHVVGVEDLDVLEGQHLEEEVVPGTFGGVACTAFFGTEDTPPDASGLKEPDKSPGYPLRSVIKAGRTTHPIQNLRFFAGGGPSG